MISKLHYIIPDSEQFHKESWYKLVCGFGIDWIQLRWKTISDEEFVKRVEEVREWTKPFDVTLIVNDRIHLKDQIEVDGFHLGKEDLKLKEGRKIATDQILGATTNKEEDILKASKEGADYVGLGPYKFTRTKENLSPILGYLGIRNILNKLPKEGIPPIIAIGNIKTKDVGALLDLGIHRVAISSYFNENTESRIKEMLKIIAEKNGK